MAINFVMMQISLIYDSDVDIRTDLHSILYSNINMKVFLSAVTKFHRTFSTYHLYYGNYIMCKDSKILFLEIHCGVYYIHVLLCLNTWTMDSCYYTNPQSWGFKGLRSTLSVVKIDITWMCKKLQMSTKSFYNIQVTST